METKTCSVCKKELPVTDFSKHKSSKDGIRSYCKVCAKLYKDKWDKDNEEHRKEYKTNYNQEHAQQNRDYSRKYYYENLEKCREYNRQRKRLKTRETKEYNKKYHSKHYQIKKDEIKRKVKEYQKENHEKTKVYKRKNKLLREQIAKDFPCTFTAEQWEDCLSEFNSQCAYCGTKGNLTQDHVIPVTKGGSYEITNIVPACPSCNSSKNNSELMEWYPKQDFFTHERLNKINVYITSKR